MSGWLPDDATEWQGRPVVRRVADAEVRGRAVLAGVVRSVVVHRQPARHGPLPPGDFGSALDAWLDDGTGTITLRWLGRDAIPGVVAGARLRVEGTVSSQSDRLVMLNPRYLFPAAEPPDVHVSDGSQPASRPAPGRAPGPAPGPDAADPVQAGSSTS